MYLGKQNTIIAIAEGLRNWTALLKFRALEVLSLVAGRGNARAISACNLCRDDQLSDVRFRSSTSTNLA
eukprot:9196345-Karenia_brevis.AAC.1